MVIPRGWLRVCGTFLFAGSAAACSALLGFEDRSLDPLVASGPDATDGDGPGILPEASTADGSSGGPPPPAPTNVVAANTTPVGDVRTLAGSGVAGYKDGQGIAADFKNPYGLIVEPGGNVFVADSGNDRIRLVTVNGAVSAIAGNGLGGTQDGMGIGATFSTPGGLGLDAAGIIYVPDYDTHRIRKLVPGASVNAGVVTTLAGSGTAASVDGTGSAASFNTPITVAADAVGNVYVAELIGNRIRKVTPAGEVTTLAGSGASTFADGTGAAASFNGPVGIAVTPSGDTVYVADNGNNRIRKITAAGVVTTVAGSGAPSFSDGTGVAAIINNPTGLAYHAASGDLYFGDSANGRIRRITPAGIVTTLCGQALKGFADAKGELAMFESIQGVAVDSVGTVYVADYGNHRIRKVTVSGIGELEVTWKPPADAAAFGVKSYVATATPVKPGGPTKTCTANVGVQDHTCTIAGLTTGAPYRVTVTAKSAAATSPPSAASLATPN